MPETQTPETRTPETDDAADEAVRQAIDAACKAILTASDTEQTGETAMATIVKYVLDSLEEGHCQDIALNYDYDLSEDDWTYDDVRNALEGTIEEFLGGPEYAAQTMRLYRAIRVTCPPDEVRRDGTAQAIGACWSTSETIADPSFLAQYGEDGGRDVKFVAEVDHADVDWLETLAARCNPWIEDYCEIVLRCEARPRILSVNDPGVVSQPSAP